MPDASPSPTELIGEGRVQIIDFGKEIGVFKHTMDSLGGTGERGLA